MRATASQCSSSSGATVTASIVRAAVSLRQQFGDECLDTGVDLVADLAHRVEVLSRGILERPVFVLLSGVDRAGVAASHCDHHIGGPYDFVGERLGELLAH